jgi:hypothetical protein
MPADAFVADTPPRPLTNWERDVLAALAPAQDPDALRVHSHCSCGCASVSFVPKLRDHALLAEAETVDTDGTPIWFLLFGSDDRSELDELEIQRADGTPLRELPDPRTLRPETR